MSIVTGRRLNRFYKALSKSFKEIDKKLESVLYSTETDDHIFSDSKSGFVPKTKRKYEEEFRYLRADGKWTNPISDYPMVMQKQEYYVDAQYEVATEDITPPYFGEGIMLINVYKKSNIGSAQGVSTLLNTYAYSVARWSAVDPNFDYEQKETVKIAALSGGLTSTYGTISGVSQTDKDSGYGVVRVKVNKGYAISIKTIY